MKISFCFLFALAASLCLVHGQECSNGWVRYNDMCWFFSEQDVQPQAPMQWISAESWCQGNHGHLASFATVDERDWVYNSYLANKDDTRWWIGLTDSSGENDWKWTDNTVYDPAVQNWKFNEPSNSGKEDCVEIWVDQPLYTGQWNDNQCEIDNRFICKRQPGDYPSCPIGWQQNGDSCYQVVQSAEQWTTADVKCKAGGGNLVSIITAEEQTFVASLMDSTYQYWIGLSDTDNPGTLQWSTHESTSYKNFATGQPTDPLPNLGSTCVYLKPNGGLWSMSKCSTELRYICKRGLQGTCPPGWLLLADKCYEIVINENRLQTWTTAKEMCTAAGATMLKIETDEQEKYIGNILNQFLKAGFTSIWLGASDMARDETFAWADSTPVVKTYWDINMPRSVVGQQDCVSLYTGKAQTNWETSTCFYEQPFICEAPEGTRLPPAGVITTEGKCESGWLHFRGFCYQPATVEKTQSDASAYCTQNQASLTSILNADEQSFLVGSIQSDSWIGLTYQSGYKWTDGNTVSFMDFDNGQTNQACNYMKEANGAWVGDNCNVARLFVCKKVEIQTSSSTIAPPTGNPADIEKCGTGGWFSDPSSDQCYLVNVFTTRTWFDARHECQVAGGDLVSINSPQEQNFLHVTVGNVAVVANVWTGGNDFNDWVHDTANVVDQGWMWSDGSPFNFLNWEDGEPNNSGDEDCLELYVATGKWNDIDCYSPRHYMCEKTGKVSNIIGTDVADSDCKSNEACCFKHLGVEYGGPLDDSVLTASTERSENYAAARGRLNTPADVIIINDNIKFGTGHGAWMPKDSDPEPWLQVDFEVHKEIKGIITQGRNGLIQYTERQWTTKFKIKYSQDPNNVGAAATSWEWLSDSDNQPIVFPANADQNTQVTNLFPRPLIARHIRCYPVDWKDKPAVRLEYIGCTASCLHKLGMNSGFIPDSMISASSSTAGKAPRDARAPVDKAECLSGNDKGASYRGWIAKTSDGTDCQRWDSQSPHSHQTTSDKYPDAGLKGNYCRNPDGKNGPWCYTTNPDVTWAYCTIPTCPSYTPTGWSPASTNADQYVQVQFSDYFKVSGMTLYKTGSSSYVKRYYLLFSDDGVNFNTYKAQSGGSHLFFGLDAAASEYTDILREPISTKFIRIQPQQWQGSILMQFEINGCYVESRITCADKAIDFDDTSFTITCPSGCVEDASGGIVYGTTVYTEHSAICPAAVHAGRATNDHGGEITVAKTTGLVSYTGSFANGIQSFDFAESHLSMEFDGSIFRCDDGWRAWRDHCYYLSPKNYVKNWHDAEAECVGMGATLATINSQGENDFIESYVVQADVGSDIWIGMNDLRTQNYYEWVDDSKVVLTKWMFGEPNGGHERCVNIYRLEGYWNDKECDTTIAFLCKKEKQLLPPLDPGVVVTDSGCEPGWSAYGSSCYQTSPDEFMFIYANRICEESGAKLASVHNSQEQSFVHALITGTLPPGLGYTAWIGLAAKVQETGGLYYTWESGETVTYTHWDDGQPDIRFSCAFPFTYKGNTYYECTTVDHPARLENTPWCSIDSEYRGRWINCGTGDEYGCTYLDDQTGYWNIDICGQNRYYVCEKDRVGYTQPGETTPSTVGTCDSSRGWYGDSSSAYCYQPNEYADADATFRRSWSDSVEHCRTQGADLVSVHSNEEESAIMDVVLQQAIYSYTYFWIGLNDIDLESGYQWTDGSPVEYTNWALDEPNNWNGEENCAEGQFYDVTTGWNDLNCNDRRNWICKIPKGVTPLDPPDAIPPMGSEDQIACGSDEKWIRYQTDSGEDKCYAFITERVYGWQYAENDCLTLGGHLVAIHGNDESLFLLSRTIGLSVERMWIGLRDVGDRAFMWSDGTPLDYQNWASGEPNNYYNSEGCAELAPDNSYWNDDSCSVLYPYICEKELGAIPGTVQPSTPITGNCPDGYVGYGSYCYIVGGDSYYSWSMGREWCTNNSADLAVITNEFEQAFLNNWLWGIGSNFWIGLSDRELANGKFVWVDQSEVAYTNWAQGEPSAGGEGCAEIMANKDGLGTWNDLLCDNVLQFVCSVKKDASIPAPQPTTSPLGCPQGYYSSVAGQACYKLVDSPMTWSAARQACQSEGQGIDIVSMDGTYDNDLLKSWFWTDITGDTVWLGMQFTVQTYENGAKELTFSWADGWPNTYTNWGPDEPSQAAIDTGSGCVLMNRDGTWSAVPTTGGSSCGTPMSFVCKMPIGEIPTAPDLGDGKCDPNFFHYDSNCYFVEFGLTDETTRSWYEAAYACESRGALLSSFHSHEEVQAVIQAISGQPSHNLFIGLESNGFDGWQWNDGTGADYFNWGENEPNGLDDEECVEMYPWDGTWNDVSCFENRGYVCKTPQSFSRCSLHISKRVDCGFDGIDEIYCVDRRGCCWDETYVSANFSGCFYPDGTIIGPSGEPVQPSKEPVSGGGLSGGAIAGIIIGVLALVALIAGGVFYFRGDSKSLPSMPSMPPMPWSTSSGAAATSKPTSDSPKGGFDNPMSLGDDGHYSVA